MAATEASDSLDALCDVTVQRRRGNGSQRGQHAPQMKAHIRFGIPPIQHLGHSISDLQLAAGVDIAIVSKRLRHSSIKITNDTYGHMIGTIGRQAAEAAAALVPRRQKSA